MNKKIYMIFIEGVRVFYTQHNDLKTIEKEAKKLANTYNKDAIILESISLITPDEINVKVDSYESALEYLGRENNACICGISDKHIKALNALNKLFTIAEAWNKADNFVPDFDNCNQYKFFPWFMYKDKSAGLVYAGTTFTASSAYAGIGSRLCFKTDERAEQFGKQFIQLWNYFLLLNK